MVRPSFSGGSAPVRLYCTTSPIGPRRASRYRRWRAAAYIAPPPTWTARSLVVANVASSDTAQADAGACTSASVASQTATIPYPLAIVACPRPRGPGPGARGQVWTWASRGREGWPISCPAPAPNVTEGKSIIPQGHEWIDAGRAAGGDQAGADCDERQDERDRREGRRVGRRHLHEQGREHPAHTKRRREPEAHPQPELPQPPLQDQPRHLAALGAERHPHADFRRPLRDRIRHDGVEADRRHHERDDSENREESAEHPVRPCLLRDHLLQGLDREDRLVRIYGLHFAAHGVHDDAWVHPAADQQRDARRRGLTVWRVHDRERVRTLRLRMPDRRGGPDDGTPSRDGGHRLTSPPGRRHEADP